MSETEATSGASSKVAPEHLSAALDQAFADLAANRPAQDILALLQPLESACQGPARARFLHARGLVLNRQGTPDKALSDLHEAADLFAKLGNSIGASRVWRAIALVHNWRGDGREASLALLRAIAELSDNPLDLALTLFEAGRLEIEIGRLADAHRFLARGLEIGGDAVPILEMRRAKINALQALVGLGDLAGAQAIVDGLDLADATPRLQHLTQLECARIAMRKGALEEAHAILASAAGLLPPNLEDFDRIEQAHVEAELCFARQADDETVKRIAPVIARYAGDDLAGREVGARILESQAFARLGRADEADRTLGAALRRAVARGLSGYADAVRERLAARGRPPGLWVPGLDPAPATQGGQGRFIRRHPLGAGGFGSVSSAYDLEFGGEVALKRLGLATLFDPAVRSGLIDAARMEVEAASRIQHPGVGRVFGLLMEPDGDGLLVRELIEGPTLRDAMAGKLHLAEKLGLLAQMAHSLAAIHAASIVHRDLKPENVILRDGRSPVIIDFGISVIGRLHQSKAGPRTKAYAAPEQVNGGWVDARSDLYAFGVIAYELLVGALPEPPARGLEAVFTAPMRADKLTQKLGGLPSTLVELIIRLLSAWPRRRSFSARDVALTIEASLAARRA